MAAEDPSEQTPEWLALEAALSAWFSTQTAPEVPEDSAPQMQSFVIFAVGQSIEDLDRGAGQGFTHVWATARGQSGLTTFGLIKMLDHVFVADFDNGEI